MNPAALLALIGDLYAEVGALRAENNRLKSELVEMRADKNETMKE